MRYNNRIAEHITSSISVTYSILPQVTLLFYYFNVNPISVIEIHNATNVDIEDITLRIRAQPAFIASEPIHVGCLRANTTVGISITENIQISEEILGRIANPVRGVVDCYLQAGDGSLLCHQTVECMLNAPTHWTGYGDAPEMIESFVAPNDDGVAITHAVAIQRAQSAQPAQSDTDSLVKMNVLMFLQALWNLVNELHIGECGPPVASSRTGLDVRSPALILSQRRSNSLEIALFIASCLDRQDISTMIVFLETRVMVAVWIEAPRKLAEPQVLDWAVLQALVAQREIVLLQTDVVLSAVSGSEASLTQALEWGAGELSRTGERTFEVAIDISTARRCRRYPPFRSSENPVHETGTNSAIPLLGTFSNVSTAPPAISNEEPPTNSSFKRWKRSLLDLSLRNRLLNFKYGQGCVEVHISDHQQVLDAFARGERLSIVPSRRTRSSVPFPSPADDDQMPYKPAMPGTSTGTDKAELIVSPLAHDTVASRLSRLNRDESAAREETGSRSLYLIIGFVAWTPRGGERSPSYQAPLLMVPVTIERPKYPDEWFSIGTTDDPIHINPTLGEFIRQEFGINNLLDVMSTPPPRDTSLVRHVLDTVAFLFASVPNLQLQDTCVISLCSFSKQLIWEQLESIADRVPPNSVVECLINGAATFQQPDASKNVDEHVPAALLRLPFLADSSQTSAIAAAVTGHDIVLVGPPGTGKSQTIANLISHLIGDGKTVLFVAQKTSALTVVHERLRTKGLDQFCLELHSSKMPRGSLMRQLEQTWREAEIETETAWNLTARRVSNARVRLNGYVKALHTIWPNGLTVFSVMGSIIEARDLAPGISVTCSNPSADTKEISEKRDDIARRLEYWRKEINEPLKHPLRAIRRSSWTAPWERSVALATQRLRDAARNLRSAERVLAALIEWPSVSSLEPMQYRIDLLLALEQLGTSNAMRLISKHLPSAIAAAAEAKRKQDAAAQTFAHCELDYKLSVWTVSLDAVAGEWERASRSHPIVRWWQQRQAWTIVGYHVDTESDKGSHPQDPGAELRILSEAQKLYVDSENVRLRLVSMYGRDIPTCEELLRASHIVELTQKSYLASNAEMPEDLARACIASIELVERTAGDEFRTAVEDVRAALDTFKEALSDFDAETRSLHPAEAYEREFDLLEAIEDHCDGILNHIEDLRTWSGWLAVAEEAHSIGLGPVLQALESASVKISETRTLVQTAFQRGWLDAVTTADATLGEFLGGNHSEAISRFRELDDTLTELASIEIKRALRSAITPRGEAPSKPEWSTFERLLTVQRHQPPIRRLLQDLPDVVRRLAPCVMMSPTTVAQYLSPNRTPFDVVIIDEASQLPTAEAILALAHGRTAVISGDPKQLPPTSFFDRADVDDGIDIGDFEGTNVLEDCIMNGVPQLLLKTHYRTKHESLIAFSNEKYYNGDLVTFPSSFTSDSALELRYTPEGEYQRGKGVNLPEAASIAAELERRLTRAVQGTSSASIGIITLNSNQQNSIDSLLAPLRGQPEFASFFDQNNPDRVFVKNIETVQGDERDVILVSIGYGPDPVTGNLHMNFGPLNRLGGERRLNVAITRARHNMVVFTALRHSMLSITPATPRGVRDLRDFLKYAEMGTSALITVARAPRPVQLSKLEALVKHRLENLGWEVHTLIGVSGFRVGLGIVHPQHSDRYLAGIECDGEVYRSASSARDRDNLYPTILADRGWRTVRLWSPDWFANPERETLRVHKHLVDVLGWLANSPNYKP